MTTANSPWPKCCKPGGEGAVSRLRSLGLITGRGDLDLTPDLVGLGASR